MRPQTADDAARKTVTVVFIDLTGSTALGERFDAETLRDVMSRYFATAQTALERHGGTVEKFIGDAVMAVFGVPAVHEDDAIRAVRAVIELRDGLERLSADLERDYGVRVDVRTGVNTGEVIVGGVGSAAAQRLATGDAVNVAARLEQAASPGEILVGAATYAVVRDIVVAEEIPPLDAKGKREQVSAWRLLAVKPDVPAFARPIRTPFVGRQRELADLERAFAAAVRERTCHLATIVGAPGIGKSRLARELVDSVQAKARIAVGRCAAYGHGSSYLPLAEIVRDVAGDDPHAELLRLLSGVERGQSAARLIAGAIGASTDAGSPEETAWAFRRLFEALGAARPLGVIVDDIHWAEPALLDLLEHVVGTSSGSPVVIVCLARPDLLDSRPSWAAARANATLVVLEPLADQEAESLIAALDDEHELPPPLRRRIVETSEGNPLFVEQLLAMLADDPDASVEAVPGTIQSLIAARIDRLDPDERAVVERAAVEGRVFHRGPVAELLDRSDASRLDATLLALERKEFVRPDRSLFAGDEGFRFNHVLIRDVAYSSIPKKLRADLHVRLAMWLEAHAEELWDRDEIVGYHLERAYLYRAELGRLDEATRALAERAGNLLGAAGRRAGDRFEPGTAIRLLDRACDLLEEEPRARAALLVDLGRALRDSGAVDRAASVLDEALAEAGRFGDEQAALHAEMELARVDFMRERSPDALRDIAGRAIAVFHAAGNNALLADAWQLLGMAELAALDRGAQLRALLKAREYATASGDIRRQIEAWNAVGGAMLHGRTPVAELVAFLEVELAWGRERGLAAVEADALLGGAHLFSRLGRFEEARESHERSMAICRDLGLTYGLAELHLAGAELELLDGDPAAAELELRDAMRLIGELGAGHYVAVYRTRLAHVLLHLGREEDARAELEAAREVVGQSALWKTGRARILARRGSTEAAVALAREAVESTETSDDITFRARLLVHRAEVLVAGGYVDEAVAALTEAVTLHEEKGNIVNAQQCHALLDSLTSAAR